jgi:predicted metalloprotease
MRWRGREESTNIEDRRGIGGGGLAIGGGIGTLVIALLAFLFGADPRQFLEQAPTAEQAPAAA